VAKSEEAHRRLRALMKARGIEREYLALVEGRPPARTGTIDAPLGRDRRERKRMSIDTDAPRTAVTHFAVERALPESTLLRVRLETGRTHQIRAHLRAIGHPVAGDPEYGHPGLYGLERQFLHATRLAFDHPIEGGRVDVESPLPQDLAAALDRALTSSEGGPSKAAPPRFLQAHPTGRRGRGDEPFVRAGPPEVGEGRADPQYSKRRREGKLA
jgi:23S rRNA pseudouridine1911/1915/1917 synthase